MEGISLDILSFLTGGKVGIVLQCICDRMLANASRTCWNVVGELYEETGYRFEIDRLVFIQERFYKAENLCHHEIVFFYLMKDADIKLQNGMNTDQLNEKLYWLPIEKLENINLVPAFLKTAVAILSECSKCDESGTI